MGCQEKKKKKKEKEELYKANQITVPISPYSNHPKISTNLFDYLIWSVTCMYKGKLSTTKKVKVYTCILILCNCFCMYLYCVVFVFIKSEELLCVFYIAFRNSQISKWFKDN